MENHCKILTKAERNVMPCRRGQVSRYNGSLRSSGPFMGGAGSHPALRTAVRVIAVSLLLCAAMMIPFASAAPEDEPDSVLVIHSYDQGLAWTYRQNEGILNTLAGAEESLQVYVEYMDSRNYPDSGNLERFREYCRYKYSDREIDIVITTDEAALRFALDNRAELFSDAPVVFSGVSESAAKEIIGDRTGVTGIVEEIDAVGTVKAAFGINPGIKKIYVIFDDSANSVIQGQSALEAIKEYAAKKEVVALNGSDTKKVLDSVSNAEDNSIVIFSALTAGNAADMSGFNRFCAALGRESRAPVYQLYDTGFGNGAVGGSMVSGAVQGEEAAKLALRILEGEDISGMPFEKKNTTRYVFDYKALQRFNIDTALLPPGSEIINKPGSYLKDHRNTVLVAVVVIVMLLIFITVLLFYLKRLQTMKKELSQSNEKLTGLYEDLSLASRKLKKQYDELMAVQKDLSISEYRFELLFEKMMDGFFIFEPVCNSAGKIVDIRFLMVNPGFFRNFGMENTMVVGKTWLEVFGSPNRNLARYQNLLETGRSERFETYDPQSRKYYLVEMFLIKENQIGVIFENITDYKKALKEVRKLNAELEKRVADRTAKLREAESIDMINMILQYSKTSAAVLNKEPVDMEALVTEVFSELKLAYPDRNIRLAIETSLPRVCVDRILFRQLLQNVISNSMKFTAAREKAFIAVGCTITQDNYVFYIRDNGIGFDMKYSGKLFGLFQRLHTSDEFEGSGIGLVTVKKIIEKHDGKVWIEGKVDEGATVYFTLPLEASAQ
mgnify:CR=1 FL=1